MTKILILDGGLGTSLEQQYGVKFDDSKPLWSSHLLLNDKDTLLRCQKDFGDVPVDIILTATYQLSNEGFEGVDGDSSTIKLEKTIEDAVKIAEEAKQDHAQVALSVGPYGATMRPSQEYSGDYGPKMRENELFQWHHERLKTFVKSIAELPSRISFVALETVPRLDEIKALRQAMAGISQLDRTPYWISSLYPGDDGCLPDGSTAQEAVEAMLDPSISGSTPWAIGINCTKVWKLDSLLRFYEDAVRIMCDRGRLKDWPSLVLYPDGTNGEVYDTSLKRWALPEGESIQGRDSWEIQLSEVVSRTCERGEWRTVIVGGCCIASAQHIRRLRNKLFPPESKE